MLEIVLMQNKREDFELNDTFENCINALVCLSFIFISLGLALCEFDGKGGVKERESFEANFVGLLVILCSNVPFLVLRIIVWQDCGFKSTIFIAKNVVALVIGVVEVLIRGGIFTCGMSRKPLSHILEKNIFTICSKH